MEGIVNKLEGVDLNEFTSDEMKEVITTLVSEHKSLVSNTERGAQSLLSEKKTMEKAIDAFKNINTDPEKLDTLMTDDPELGKFILEKFYDGKSIDEIKKTNPKNIDALVDERLNHKEVEKKLSSVKNQLPADLLEKFEKEFEEITSGKKLSSDNVQKYIKNAISNISEDDNIISTIKFTASGNGGQGGTSKTTIEDKGKESVLSHLRQLGAIK